MGREYTGMSITVTCNSVGEPFFRSEGTLLVDSEDKDTLSWVGIGYFRGSERRYVSELVGMKKYRTTIQSLEGLNGKRLGFTAEIEGGAGGWYKEW